MTETIERLARGAIAQLRLVPEREQSLATSRAAAGVSQLEHLPGRQVRFMHAPRRFCVSAIMTDVATELGEGNEDFGRISDDVAPALIAQ